MSNDTPQVPERPTHCPTCRSRDLVTTGKLVNADSYWRCNACGEVWNAARLRAANPYGRYRPMGR